MGAIFSWEVLYYYYLLRYELKGCDVDFIFSLFALEIRGEMLQIGWVYSQECRFQRLLSLVFVFFSVRSEWTQKRGEGDARMLDSHWKRGIEWGVSGETVGVGDTLRNAWKVSKRSGTHWTDNPAHQITIASPSTLSAFGPVCLQWLKTISRDRGHLTFSASVLPKSADGGQVHNPLIV